MICSPAIVRFEVTAASKLTISPVLWSMTRPGCVLDEFVEPSVRSIVSVVPPASKLNDAAAVTVTSDPAVAWIVRFWGLKRHVAECDVAGAGDCGIQALRRSVLDYRPGADVLPKVRSRVKPAAVRVALPLRSNSFVADEYVACKLVAVKSRPASVKLVGPGSRDGRAAELYARARQSDVIAATDGESEPRKVRE